MIKIDLKITKKQESDLKNDFKKIIDFLERKKGSLRKDVFDTLEHNMTKLLTADKDFREILEQVNETGDFFKVNLCHTDPEILNLPWGMVKDAKSGKMLAELEQLFLTKALIKAHPKVQPPSSGPLEILVMISSPKDLPFEKLLKYEEEERLLLKAFEPLFQSGAVQVDFTEDGSLKALKRKIDANNYHILHFSGHGVFEKGKGGFLQLEHPQSLKTELASAEEFTHALIKEDFTIPLVVLSSCQTAQADVEKGMAGVAGTLLQKSIPAVVAMGLSISDKYATSFAGHFYQHIAQKKPLYDAFKFAKEKIRQEEADEIQKAHLNQMPLQWLIPNFFLTEEFQLVDWQVQFKEIKPEQSPVTFANTSMEKAGIKADVFVGRRENLSQILPVVWEKKPILLKGQGGIGKSTMARKLTQRLLANYPDIIPFIFNEEGKEFSLDLVLYQLKDFCLKKDKREWIADLENYEGSVKQIIYLLEKLSQTRSLLLFFDNVETF